MTYCRVCDRELPDGDRTPSYTDIAELRDELHTVAQSLEKAVRIIAANPNQPHTVSELLKFHVLEEE